MSTEAFVRHDAAPSSGTGATGPAGPAAGSAVRVSHADVVVVGGGGSGLAAAVEAASLNRSVILLEKAPALGGSTAWSVGSISASNTPQQFAAGILDSPADHLEDLYRFNSPLKLPENEALSRLLVENVPDTVRWLMSMGVEFYGPMKELPHRKPRMHVVLPNSRAYIHHLERRARATGVDIRTSMPAASFIMEDGRVVGVRCVGPDGEHEFRARGGVVVASGCYCASAERRARHFGPHMEAVPPVNIYNTGDGHDMIEAVGGKVINPHLYLAGLRFQPPPPRWLHNLPPHPLITRTMRFMLEKLPGALVRPFVMGFLTTFLVPSAKMLQAGAILVNRNGERFGDELDEPGPRVSQQPQKQCYIVMDARIAGRFTGWPNYVSTAPGFAYASVDDYRRNRKDIFHEADTLAQLAAKLGVPAQALERTVADTNAQRLKDGDARPTLEQGPYVAMGPVVYMINFADGGMAVSNDLEVLGQDGRPIPGLYAAGLTGMGGVLLEGHGHHLAWVFTTGRLAARRAAWNVRTEDIPEAAGAVPASH